MSEQLRTDGIGEIKSLMQHVYSIAEKHGVPFLSMFYFDEPEHGPEHIQSYTFIENGRGITVGDVISLIHSKGQMTDDEFEYTKATLSGQL